MKVSSAAYIVGAVVAMSVLVCMGLPRGLRNNNPTNLRFNPHIKWDGQKGKDNAGFAKFASASDGIRAGATNAFNYQRLHGLSTIAEIIGRWAPIPTTRSLAWRG